MEQEKKIALLIEWIKNEPDILAICEAEYLGSYGKFPAEDKELPDEDIRYVIERIGVDELWKRLSDWSEEKYLINKL